MSSPGTNYDPALRQPPAGDLQDRAYVAGDIGSMTAAIDVEQPLQLPLIGILSRQLLKVQLKPGYDSDTTVVDTNGITHRLGDVVDPEDVMLPTSRSELKEAKALETVRGLARLSFDLSMAEIEWDSDLASLTDADVSTGTPVSEWSMLPDQSEEFDAAYSQYNTFLRTYLARYFSNILHTYHDVEDAAQDSWAKAALNWNRFEEGTNRKAWLAKVASRIVLNKWRRQQNNREIAVEPPTLDVMTGFSDQDRFDGRNHAHIPNTREELEESSVQLARKLMHLGVSPTFIPTFVAIEGLGFRYEEVTQSLGIPIGGVSSKIHRAKNILKARILQEQGEYNPGTPDLVTAQQLFERTPV